jgi:hypothetical protein
VRCLVVSACLLAACGDDSRTRHDAGNGDGDGDTIDGDADIDADPNVRGPVTIHIVDKNDNPLSGMHVVFIDTDMTVTDVVTDASGNAGASVYPGATATALRAAGTGAGYSLTTVLQLVPNDTITLISAASAVSSSEDPFVQRVVPLPSADILSATKSGSVGTYTTQAPHGLSAGDRVVIAGVMPDAGFNGTRTVAAVPSTTSFTVNLGGGGLTDSANGTAYKGLPFTVSFPAYGGATSYEVHTPCGPVDVGTSTSPNLTLRAGCATASMDIAVYAKTSSTVEAAYAHQAAVAFTAGGNVTITDSWHPVTALTATYTNPTARVTDVQLDRFSPYLRGNAQNNDSGTTSGGTLQLMADVATTPQAWIRSTLECPNGASASCISSAIGVATQLVSQKVDGTQTSYALDIDANLLPWVNGVYNPATKTIDVTVTGTGTYDLFEANLRYVRNLTTIYTWRVFGPTAQSVSFPTLPSSLPGDPTIGDTDTQSAYQLYICESDALSGYRDAIKNPYVSLQTCESPSTPTLRPAAGTINRRSSWN